MLAADGDCESTQRKVGLYDAAAAATDDIDDIDAGADDGAALLVTKSGPAPVRLDIIDNFLFRAPLILGMTFTLSLVFLIIWAIFTADTFTATLAFGSSDFAAAALLFVGGVSTIGAIIFARQDFAMAGAWTGAALVAIGAVSYMIGGIIFLLNTVGDACFDAARPWCGTLVGVVQVRAAQMTFVTIVVILGAVLQAAMLVIVAYATYRRSFVRYAPLPGRTKALLAGGTVLAVLTAGTYMLSLVLVLALDKPLPLASSPVFVLFAIYAIVTWPAIILAVFILEERPSASAWDRMWSTLNSIFFFLSLISALVYFIVLIAYVSRDDWCFADRDVALANGGPGTFGGAGFPWCSVAVDPLANGGVWTPNPATGVDPNRVIAGAFQAHVALVAVFAVMLLAFNAVILWNLCNCRTRRV
jgi:hypothetical protein